MIQKGAEMASYIRVNKVGAIADEHHIYNKRSKFIKCSQNALKMLSETALNILYTHVCMYVVTMMELYQIIHIFCTYIHLRVV